MPSETTPRILRGSRVKPPGRVAPAPAYGTSMPAATFGAPQMDRRDATTRVLRYTSDACILFVFVQGSRAAYADAYDPHLRPLKPIDQCAGSVATQKRNIS